MSNCLAKLERNLSLGNIECYISWASQIPVLSVEEELSLTTKLQQDQDVNAAKKLILHHLRFVIHIARSYNGYGLPLADLIQEGNIGLMKALKKFNPGNGVRLISYAVHWIKAEMHEYILQNIKSTKIATTKAQRKLFFNLRKLKSGFGSKKSLAKQEITAIADKLNVTEKEVITMEQRLYNLTEVSVDNQCEEDGAHNVVLEQCLADSSTDQVLLLEQDNWHGNKKAKLTKALALLSDREKHIIESRWLSEKKQTLASIAEKFSISTERVRQLEAKALQILQQYVTRPE